MIIMVIVVNLVVIFGLLKGKDTRSKLINGLLKMYKDQNVDQYYDSSIVTNYDKRYLLFIMAVVSQERCDSNSVDLQVFGLIFFAALRTGSLLRSGPKTEDRRPVSSRLCSNHPSSVIGHVRSASLRLPSVIIEK